MIFVFLNNCFLNKNIFPRFDSFWDIVTLSYKIPVSFNFFDIKERRI